jgi:regulator of nucleoside diphosphate kinase
MVMAKKIIITDTDYQRLIGLIGFTTETHKMPEKVAQLFHALRDAERVLPEQVPENVVTMNSRVLLKDLSNRREAELTITYPHEADHRERKVSVFSSIGTALLGMQAGDIVSWKVPVGKGNFQILKVTYQPESVGDYYL